MNVRARRFLAFWRLKGTAAVVGLVRQKLANAIAGRPIFNTISDAGTVGGNDEPTTVQELVRRRFESAQPLQTYLIPKAAISRISLITDSIGSGSLFGGVGTALLLAAQLANRTNSTLRIVTRTEVPSPKNAAQILAAYGVELLQDVQFAFAPVESDVPAAGRPSQVQQGLDIQPDETFITTSWWTTAATLPAVPPAAIIYLLQEDERMFYPFGEDRAHCEAVLRKQGIRFVINTQLLYDHLIASGLDHLKVNAVWFEPAFPESLFHQRAPAVTGKKRFFFYARPHNLRNLFHIGIQVIDQAINEGILDLDEWDVYLVGKDIPNVSFGDGYLPIRCEGLDWKAYADLVGTIDMGLSLMYTPHPSYPPFDLAASGAVVVTNKFGNKQDLSAYSQNIICAELDTDSLLAAVKEGIALAGDSATRRRNYLANGFEGSWPEAFEETLQSLTGAR